MPSPDALHELSAQLDTIFASVPVAIGLFDLEVRHVRVNELLAAMNGLPASELLGRTPAELHGPVGVEAEALYRQVLETGEPMHNVALSGEVGSRPGDRREWVASFAPVRNGTEVIGLLVTVGDETEQRRLTAALASSELGQRRLAEDLQRALMPRPLPTLPGAELASVYRPASGGSARVGGDFYDVIRTGDDSWALVVGDVQGKGPVAASLTAAVRYAIRTATVVAPEPVQVLRTVNEMLLQENREDAQCTVAFVLAERGRDGIRLRSVAAGHPLPLVIRQGSGRVEPLGRHSGTLLGAFEDPDLFADDAVLAPGDLLVLYTDGVTDARAINPDGTFELFGTDRLAATLNRHWSSAAELADHLDRAISDFQDGRLVDDVAALVLQARSTS